MDKQAISVVLPRSVAYVSGTVNDTAVTWTLAGGNTWQAIADRAEDEIYRVSMSIINSAGTVTQTQFTLYYGLQLITDRTQADVDRGQYLASLWVGGEFTGTADELVEWNSALKGFYNASDLNRVGNAINYVAERFTEAGYLVQVSPRIDWTEADIPLQSDMEHYLADVSALRELVTTPVTTPPVPDDMEGLTYIEANNIEQILLDLDDILTRMISAYIYSNEVYCGEV